MDSHRAVWTPISRLGALWVACAVLPALASCTIGINTASKHLEIATLFAVSGPDAAMQLPAQYGVDLAASQAHLPDGYTLRVVHDNYGGVHGIDATVGAAAARAVVNNAHVIGVVGPLNSGIAEVVMPITNLAGLSVVSPTNTYPGLTLPQYALDYGLDWSLLHPAGHPNRYFRIAAHDVEQGQLDAYVAGNTLGAKAVFVVDDNTPYGRELANSFTSAFTSVAGHSIVSAPGTSIGDFNLPSLVSAIVAQKPDLVYYGGVTRRWWGAAEGLSGRCRVYQAATGWRRHYQ